MTTYFHSPIHPDDIDRPFRNLSDEDLAEIIAETTLVIEDTRRLLASSITGTIVSSRSEAMIISYLIELEKELILRKA